MPALTPSKIADYFIRTANEVGSPITNLKLQKLVYYAQAWSLALRDRTLFEDDFEAWVHGPVTRQLWDEYKTLRWQPIVKDVPNITFDQDVENFLKEVVQVYFACDAYELERMTHEEAPWREARGNLPPDAPCSNVISKDRMASFYKELAQQN